MPARTRKKPSAPRKAAKKPALGPVTEMDTGADFSEVATNQSGSDKAEPGVRQPLLRYHNVNGPDFEAVRTGKQTGIAAYAYGYEMPIPGDEIVISESEGMGLTGRMVHAIVTYVSLDHFNGRSHLSFRVV